MNEAKPWVIFLLGPTCSGKTDAAIRLNQYLPCEIISVDSALVYRGMDIGTAKPSLQSRMRLPHHLIDILEPEARYSAVRFRADATRLVHEIHARGKVPVLAGGTMFYFKVFEHGIDEIPDVSDAVRDEVEVLADTYGLEFLYEELQQKDPASAEQIHPNDSQRIKRAVEVYRSGAGLISDFQCGKRQEESPWRILKIALNFNDRSVLHQRIERRFDEMLESGLVEETARLMLRPALNADLPSMRVVGYAQTWAYLMGSLGFGEMRNRAVYATRQLAKRQLTWMRGMTDLKFYDMDGGGSRNAGRDICKIMSGADYRLPP